MTRLDSEALPGVFGRPGEAPRFALYGLRTADPSGMQLEKSFIVLRRGPFIVQFTALEQYAPGYRVVQRYASSSHSKHTYIVQFMNYMGSLVPWDREIYHDLLSWTGELAAAVTPERMQDFFDLYAMGGLPGQKAAPAMETDVRCIHTVTAFVSELKRKHPVRDRMALCGDDLYVTGERLTGQGTVLPRRRVRFRVASPSSGAAARFRDLPWKAFVLLLELSFHYAPDISLALAAQALAGLREGEVLNLRQESSPLGPGILFTYEGDVLSSIVLDVRKEHVLRRDLVPTGTIKRPRLQHVYPSFNALFFQIYTRHLEHLRSHGFDSRYCPLFVDGRGSAMTYAVYRDRFRSLVRDRFVPALLASEDPDLYLYGMLARERGLAPHCLRHAFSCMLVLMGEDIHGLQMYRGDASPASCQPYLDSKKDILDRFRSAQSGLIDLLSAVVGPVTEKKG